MGPNAFLCCMEYISLENRGECHHTNIISDASLVAKRVWHTSERVHRKQRSRHDGVLEACDYDAAVQDGYILKHVLVSTCILESVHSAQR